MRINPEKIKANINRWLNKANDVQLRAIAIMVYLIVVYKDKRKGGN